MRVLVVGGGGREHAILWKLSKDNKNMELHCAPGNAGIAEIAKCHSSVSAENIEGIKNLCKELKIELAVIGPEVPLALGIVDELEAEGIKVFGPDKSCARLEASKAFTKEFLARHKIPTAGYKEYTEQEELLKDVGVFGYPMVIKADGLAAGKGVVIAENKEDAEKAIRQMMGDKVFGAAGDKIVVEEFLTGIEASILCFVDEETIIPMEPAQDYKRIFDGDKGGNTGGMGTYSPSLIIDEDLKEIIDKEILQPTLAGFKKDGLKFKGVLFIGLMIKDGKAKVIEFNNRFGDPETQSVLPRMETNLLDVFLAVIDNKLAEINLKWSEERTICIIEASKGYPDAYEKGVPIEINQVEEGIVVFHSGTALKDEKLVTAGGRVLGVVATGSTHTEAREKAYRNIENIKFAGMQYRKDIGLINSKQ